MDDLSLDFATVDGQLREWQQRPRRVRSNTLERRCHSSLRIHLLPNSYGAWALVERALDSAVAEPLDESMRRVMWG